jgi:segregation and condensation protein A
MMVHERLMRNYLNRSEEVKHTVVQYPTPSKNKSKL